MSDSTSPTETPADYDQAIERAADHPLGSHLRQGEALAIRVELRRLRAMEQRVQLAAETAVDIEGRSGEPPSARWACRYILGEAATPLDTDDTQA